MAKQEGNGKLRHTAKPLKGEAFQRSLSRPNYRQWQSVSDIAKRQAAFTTIAKPAVERYAQREQAKQQLRDVGSGVASTIGNVGREALGILLAGAQASSEPTEYAQPQGGGGGAAYRRERQAPPVRVKGLAFHPKIRNKGGGRYVKT